MSGYTVEIRTAIGTNQNLMHTWLQITCPDGSQEAYGFYPETDSFGNIRLMDNMSGTEGR
jgi:hypothetical protein